MELLVNYIDMNLNSHIDWCGLEKLNDKRSYTALIPNWAQLSTQIFTYRVNQSMYSTGPLLFHHFSPPLFSLKLVIHFFLTTEEVEEILRIFKDFSSSIFLYGDRGKNLRIVRTISPTLLRP